MYLKMALTCWLPGGMFIMKYFEICFVDILISRLSNKFHKYKKDSEHVKRIWNKVLKVKNVNKKLELDGP